MWYPWLFTTNWSLFTWTIILSFCVTLILCVVMCSCSPCVYWFTSLYNYVSFLECNTHAKLFYCEYSSRSVRQQCMLVLSVRATTIVCQLYIFTWNFSSFVMFQEDSAKCVGGLISTWNIIIQKSASKNEISQMDVGMSSIQAYKAHKQPRGHSAHLVFNAINKTQ